MLNNKKTTAEPYHAQKGKIKHFVAFSCLVTDPKQSIVSSTHLWLHHTALHTSRWKQVDNENGIALEAQIDTRTPSAKPSAVQ